MITETSLNELVLLKKQYDELRQSFENQDYEARISLLREDSQRKAIESILNHDEYRQLSQYHLKRLYSRVVCTEIIFDVCALLIPNDREARLKNKIKHVDLRIDQSIIPELCRKVAVALERLRDPDTHALEQEKRTKELEISQIRRDYEDRIVRILRDSEIYSSTHPSEQSSQLLITDSSNGDTIGHHCVRENICHREYTRLFCKLTSEDKLQVLCQLNNDSIAMLILCRNDGFINLVSALEPRELNSLLQMSNVFENVMKRMSDSEFLNHYWTLLKEKFETSTAYRLAKLFATEKQKGWMDYSFVKFASSAILIEYLNVYPQDCSQRIHEYMLGRLRDRFDTPIEQGRVMCTYLELFQLKPQAIQEFARIGDLKKNTCDYLLELAKNPDNLNLLEMAVDKKTTLGQFCWEWRRITRSMPGIFSLFKEDDVPATIQRLRNRIVEIQALSSVSVSLLPEAIASAPPMPVAMAVAYNSNADSLYK